MGWVTITIVIFWCLWCSFHRAAPTQLSLQQHARNKRMYPAWSLHSRKFFSLPDNVFIRVIFIPIQLYCFHALALSQVFRVNLIFWSLVSCSPGHIDMARLMEFIDETIRSQSLVSGWFEAFEKMHPLCENNPHQSIAISRL